MADDREAQAAIRAINGSKLNGSNLNVEVSVVKYLHDMSRLSLLKFFILSPTYIGEGGYMLSSNAVCVSVIALGLAGSWPFFFLCPH